MVVRPGTLTASTQTVAWVVIFFLASAGASAAYLTVSEIFPMETRALAIAFFYAVGTGLGGIIGPVLFGQLIATKRPGDVAVGLRDRRSSSWLARAWSRFSWASMPNNRAWKRSPHRCRPRSRQRAQNSRGRRCSRRPQARSGRTRPHVGTSGGWRGRPDPRRRSTRATDTYLAREVDAIVDALERLSPQSPLQLSRSVAAQYWGPGRFRTAVRSGLASGRIRRVGRHSLAAASRPPARSLVGADSEYRH